MQTKRAIRVAAASLYGLLLALGRPTVEALVPRAGGILWSALVGSVFIVAAVLGLSVALGPGSWWRRLVLGLTIWALVVVLYYIGCGQSDTGLQGDLAVPTSACTLLFTALAMAVARLFSPWRLVDTLAPADLKPAHRQFSLLQLMWLILVLSAGFEILQVAIRGAPPWLSWPYFASIALQPSWLLTNVLFCALALPWMLAAFAGWRAVLLAVTATVVTAGGILAYVMCWIIPRFGTGAGGPTAAEFIALTIILSLIPTLPSYAFVLVLRWLGLRIEWRRTRRGEIE